MLGACGGSGVMACSLVGCSSLVRVDVSQVWRTWPHATTVRACLEDQCETFGPPRQSALPQVGPLQVELNGPRFSSRLRRSHEVPVSVEVVGRQGRILFHAARTVAVTRSAPNGTACGPVCFATGVTVDVRRRQLTT